MSKIIIIGGGFAGLAAAQRLSRVKKTADVILIDRRANFNFLPCLPDVIGRGLNPGVLEYSLKNLSQKYGFTFVQDEVLAVTAEKKRVKCKKLELGYDYLIICAGSQPNFYGNDLIKKTAFTLSNADDARKLIGRFSEPGIDNVIISGGGYTGVEIATNARRFFAACGKDVNISIVEQSGSILGALPGPIKEYAGENLKKMRIDVLCGVTIKNIDQSAVELSSGKVCSKPALIWSAGVKTADFISTIGVNKDSQGRITVDRFLRFTDNCFAAGDSASFVSNGRPLRMAVQFSIMEGQCAAENVLRIINGSSPREYRPFDLGYVIPMANNRSYGIVLGGHLKGIVPTLLHYLMCTYRNVGLKNRLEMLAWLFLKGGLVEKRKK